MAYNIKNHHENGHRGQKKMVNFPKIAEIWYKLIVFKVNCQVAQNPVKTNGSLQANATF